MPEDSYVRVWSVYGYRAWSLPQHETGTINIIVTVINLPEVRTLDQEFIVIYCGNWYRLHAELPWLV